MALFSYNYSMNPNRITLRKNLGWVYFYIHFAVEVVCFYYLHRLFNDAILWGYAALAYDVLAFMPQSMIGVFVQNHPRIPVGAIGGVLLVLSLFFCLSPFPVIYWMGILVLGLGNGCVHIWGAVATMTTAEGRLAPSAVFVAGGSFGVVTGMMMAKAGATFLWPLIFMSAAVVLILFTDSLWNGEEENISFSTRFDIAAEQPFGLLLLFAFIVVMIRSYVAYGIPTAWNKTVAQTIALYSSMGIGKGLGGILADRVGAKRVALFSSVVSFPFLILGNHLMYVSLTGVLLFSMTMPITLGIIASVLKNAPGLAFGVTTIGLLFGVLPTFFFRIESFSVNAAVLGILTVVATLALKYTLKGGAGKDEKDENV